MTPLGPPPAAAPATAPETPPHYRWNFVLLGLDMALFSFGLSFASFATIVPAFVRHLTDSNLLVGLLAAVVQVGWTLPALLFASYTERLPRKKRFILLVTLGERLPYLGLAGLALLAPEAPGLALAGTLLLVAVFTGTGGALGPAWLDFVARAIPVRRRGSFFGLSSALGGALGIGAAAIARAALDAHGFPTGYAICFLLAFVGVLLSYLSFLGAREIGPFVGREAEALGAYLRRLPAVLRQDHAFARYLASLTLGVAGLAAGGFYAVAAIARAGAGPSEVALFTGVFLAAQTAANPVWGLVSDRRGHKTTLLSGLACSAAATLTAAAATEVWQFGATFLLYGVSLAATNLARIAIVMEFSPPDVRPTYIGLAGASLTPVAAAGPLLGGALADALGYPPTFALFALLALASTVALWRTVEDPRRSAARTG